ncbi:MAG: DMT family transporter [Hydrogenophilales bacterium]|nr:DMT family transporter [Hydrogenophilales bacterium]
MSLSAAFISVVMIWSTTPLAIKWSALGAGASFALLARMAIGTLLCALLLWTLRVRFPLHRKARLTYLAAGLSMFGAMSLTYWASQTVNSGLISVLFGLSPLMTSLGAAYWLKEEALTPNKLAGMGLGLAGLTLVFHGSLGLGPGALLGIGVLLIAVLLQSLGMVWIKRINDDSPAVAINLGTLLVALPLFIGVWWLTDGQWPAQLTPRAAAAIVYLGVFGSVLGFVLYYYMIKHMETGSVALIMLITPVIALLLGHALNDEVAPASEWLGATCIALGLSLHQWGARWIARITSA